MRRYKILLAVLFLITCLSHSSSKETYGMDDQGVCLKDAVKVVGIEDGKSVIVIGKKTPPESATAAKECQLRFTSYSEKGKMHLRMKFENFYINDCGIELTISQSPSEHFDDHVTELAKLKCKDVSPGVLYASKYHKVMMTLSREDKYLRNYNFRINVTQSDGPPPTGPSVAVIIGIATSLVALIAIIGFILVKYLHLKNSVLRERRAERAIERALYVYNSQEFHNDVPYTSVPTRGETNGAISSGSQRNGTLHPSCHSDGDHSEERLNTISPSNGHTPLSHSPGRDGDYMNENRSSDTEAELPPSYEEALDMPKPTDTSDSPLYANAKS